MEGSNGSLQEHYENALKEILKVNTDSYEEDLQEIYKIVEKTLNV